MYSTYAIATQPQPQQLWPERCHIWEAAAPYLYARTPPDGRVLCGGEDEALQDEAQRDALLAHKTVRLEKKLSRLLPQLDGHAAFAWCGSFGASPTGLPTIGAIPDRPGCLAILAFGGNGITYSRIAAEVITAQLTGQPDVDADLFAFSVSATPQADVSSTGAALQRRVSHATVQYAPRHGRVLLCREPWWPCLLTQTTRCW